MAFTVFTFICTSESFTIL